jgi:hypothetical protein
MISNEDLEICDSFWVKSITRLLFSGEQSRKVFFHLGEMFNKLETDLLKVVKLLKEVTVLYVP